MGSKGERTPIGRGARSRTRVIAADPHPVYRQGLTEAIARRSDLELVGEAADAEGAVNDVARLSPEVAVIELKLLDGDGPGLVERITGEHETRLLLLCGHEDAAAIYAAIEAGATGCLFKEANGEEISEAIAALGRGEAAFCRRSAESIAGQIQLRRDRDGAALTERERQILKLTADGLPSGRVGEELALSQSTVKNHLSNIYAKLGVTCAAAAVSEAMRLDLLG